MSHEPCRTCNRPADYFAHSIPAGHAYSPVLTAEQVQALAAESEKAELDQRPASPGPTHLAQVGQGGGHHLLHPDNRHPNTRYSRAELADEDIPEPYLKLAAGGQATIRARKGSANVEGCEWFWELSPQRLRQMHASIAMMLRMSGAEPDPSHPWFTGLVVEGEVLAELRALVAAEPRSLQGVWDRDRGVVDRLRLLIEQNDARLRDHRSTPDATLPTPDLDPDSGP